MPSSAGFLASTTMFSDPAVLSFGGMTGEIGSFDGRFQVSLMTKRVGAHRTFFWLMGGCLLVVRMVKSLLDGRLWLGLFVSLTEKTRFLLS